MNRRVAVAVMLAVLADSCSAASHARDQDPKSRKSPKAAAAAPPAIDAASEAATPTTAQPTPSGIEGLVARLLDKKARNEARKAIVAMGTEATPYLMTRMKDKDFTIRWEMANILGSLEDPRAVPALVENVLHDAEPHVRWRSLWALNEYPSDTETLQLLRRALASSNEAEKWNAAVGLSMFKAPECLPIIHAGLTHSDPWRRWESVNALGRVHDASSVAHLAGVLKRAGTRERTEAVMSLGGIGSAEAADVLVAALADPEPGVRWRACMQLGDIGGTRTRPALEKLRATETDPMVLKHLNRSLGAPR
jgi:HEAT repeat protein